jgi:hypothetical protein
MQQLKTQKSVYELFSLSCFHYPGACSFTRKLPMD